MSAAKVFEHKNPLLNSEVINSFTFSVKDTITKLISATITAEKPFVAEKFDLQTEIAGILGVTSEENKGLFVIAFSKDAIIHIHNAMLGEAETELTDSVCDVVGELSNMIYGSSKTVLNEKGYQFKMAIPTISRGTFNISNKSKSLTIVMPFKIDNSFSFTVALTVE